MTRVLYQLSQFCVRRKFVVVGVWFVVAVVLVAVSHGLGDNTNDNLSLPGTNSQRATDTLAKSFPAPANGTSPIWNYRSSNDKVLRWLYSLAERGQKATGLTGFQSKFPSIRDCNVSRSVGAHSAYIQSVALRP